MINSDERVKKIIDWRESFVTLPDSHFFELIRMYLGEIHSPFNKQNLVQDLGAFLGREESKKTIVKLLSRHDLEVLTAVYLIPDATNEKLAAFFDGTLNFAELYERLLNLEERLLIYRHIPKNSARTVISINPVLEDLLKPYLKVSNLLPPVELAHQLYNSTFCLSADVIAAFVNFINLNPGLCKADYSIKKRDLEKLSDIFKTENAEFFNLLLKAFVNLSLVKDSPRGIQIDFPRLSAFASLDGRIQLAYLTLATHTRLSRSYLVKYARLLLDALNSIKKEGFTKTSFLRNAFLLSQKKDSPLQGLAAGGGGRFAAMLARAQQEEQNADGADKEISAGDFSIIECVFDAACTFGLLGESGIGTEGEKVFAKGNALNLAEQLEKQTGQVQKAMSIDAGFNVLIFPGLKLNSLLELMDFVELKNFDTAASFELNKKAVMFAFDRGLSSGDIYSIIQKYSTYEIPENVKMSLDDWASSYMSAELFNGIVLCVDKARANLIQNNPKAKSHIWKTFAPGVFMLDTRDEAEAVQILKSAGIEYNSTVKTAPQKIEGSAFPDFIVPVSQADRPEAPEEEVKLSSDDERRTHFESMRERLSKLTVNPEQREGLLLRINRKIVLSQSQLNAESVKNETIEAGGMDYQGKIHVAESAIPLNMMLELEYDDKDSPSGKIVLVGTPLSIEKNPMDTVVHIVVEPEHVERTLSLGAASNVKRIRGGILR
jgi:hypothetical protein